MVGKWHEGFFEPRYLPVNRGFDTISNTDHFLISLHVEFTGYISSHLQRDNGHCAREGIEKMDLQHCDRLRGQ